MKKAPPAPTPSYTINKLGDLTGFDRRTLGKRLANVPPHRVVKGRKFYTISQATDACEPVRNPAHKPTHQGETLRGNREHWLYELVRNCSAAGAALHAAMDGYFAALDHVESAFKLPANDPRRAAIESEMNLESFGTRTPLHQLLFSSKGSRSLGDEIADVLILAEKVNQRVLDIDATLAITGFFSTGTGRAMALKVRAAHGPKD